MTDFELYLDKDFVRHLKDNYSGGDYFVDICRFFRKARKFILITNYQKDEFLDIVRTNPILESLINEYTPRINLDIHLPEKLRDPEFYKSGSPFKIFFITLDSETAEKYRYKYGYEFITPANLNDRWSIYYSNRDDLKLRVTNDAGYEYRFDNWRVLSRYKHPIHSVVIFDWFILSDSDNQRLEDNLLPMLAEILKWSSPKNQTDVSIYFQQDNNKPKDLKVIHEMIRSYLKKSLDHSVFKINLVVVNKRYYPDGTEVLKDRRIYTNYFTVKSGDSFTFFKPNGKINNATEIIIEFSLCGSEWLSVRKTLDTLQRYSENLPADELWSQNRYLPNYFSDKKNRLVDN